MNIPKGTKHQLFYDGNLPDEIIIEEGASLNVYVLHKGISTKQICKVFLNGKNSFFELRGLGILNNNQDSSVDLEIEHLVGETESRVLYKNIVNDDAHGYFRGKIKIAPNAEKSVADLRNHNLLLGDGASIDTLPELEIYADDVKCSHGATSGRLDEEALFYLRARGINKSDAKKLLLKAFAEEVFSTCDDLVLKKYLADALCNN